MNLTLTVAHHDDQEFYDLGPIEHEVPPEKVLAHLPTTPPHDCDASAMCFVVDVRDEQGSIYDDREVSAELASKLIGRDVHEAIAAAQADLSDIYQSMGSPKRVPLNQQVKSTGGAS